MNKFASSIIAAALVTATLGAGTAQAADGKTVTDRPCTYQGHSFPSGSAVKTGDGHTLYCLDGDWVPLALRCRVASRFRPPRPPLGTLISIFKR